MLGEDEFGFAETMEEGFLLGDEGLDSWKPWKAKFINPWSLVIWHLFVERVLSIFFEKYTKTLKSDGLAYVLWVCVGCSPLSEPPEGAKRMLKPLKLQI